MHTQVCKTKLTISTNRPTRLQLWRGKLQVYFATCWPMWPQAHKRMEFILLFTLWNGPISDLFQRGLFWTLHLYWGKVLALLYRISDTFDAYRTWPTNRRWMNYREPAPGLLLEEPLKQQKANPTTIIGIAATVRYRFSWQERGVRCIVISPYAVSQKKG